MSRQKKKVLHLNLSFRFIKQSNLLHIIYNHLLTNLPSKIFPIYSQSEFELVQKEILK